MDKEGWVGLQDVKHETYNHLKADSWCVCCLLVAERRKWRFQPDKICTVHSFCHVWFLGLWAICWTMSLTWWISWHLPSRVMKTFVFAWWHVHLCEDYQTRLNVSFIVQPSWINYPLIRCWFEHKQSWKMIEESLAVVVLWTTWDEMRKLLIRDPCGSISCHCCNGPNHFAKDSTPEGGHPGYNVTSVAQWAIYPALVQGSKLRE